MKKVQRIFLLLVLLVGCFCFTGCSGSEVARKMKAHNRFSLIHIYEGQGNLLQMEWAGDKGLIVLNNTDYDEQVMYVNKYKGDNSYIETTELTSPNQTAADGVIGFKKIGGGYNFTVEIQWSLDVVYIWVLNFKTL